MKMSSLSPKEKQPRLCHFSYFVKRLMGKDFLKKLNSHHRSPTDTLPNNMGKLIISTEIICNKGKKNAADKYIFNQSVKNRNRRI